MDKRKTGIGIATVMLLIMAGFAMVPNASALQDLTITSDNLDYLQRLNTIPWAWFAYGVGTDPQVLNYDYGQYLNTYGGSKTLVWYGTMKTLKVRDGECVTFVNAISNKNGISANGWRRGTKVMDFATNGGSLAIGTAVATFKSDGTYDTFGTNGQNHVAVFAGWHRTWFSGIDGFYVWDANFVQSKRVGAHRLMQSSSGVYNANSYYVVQS